MSASLFPPVSPAGSTPGASAVALSAGTSAATVGNPVFSLSAAGTAASGSSPSTAQLQAMAAQAAQQYGVPVNVFQALVQQESGYQTQAVSSAGAVGLTQLMPATAASMGVTDPTDPAQSLAGGAKYLSQLLGEFHSVPLALAAYNAGPGAVNFYQGIPPYAQTQSYVASIMKSAGLGQAGSST